MSDAFLAVKSIALGNVSDVQMKLLGLQSGTDLTPHDAYQLVAFLRRAVKIRAYAVSNMPFIITKDGMDVTDTPQVKAWKLKRLLYRTEAAICIYARAYWLLELNRFGANPSPRWLLPTTVVPQVDTEQGLVEFTRTLADSEPIPLNRMVYFWEDAMDKEVGYGTSDVQAALKAANLLYNLDDFAEGFFKRGAVKATLLSVEGSPDPAELKKLEQWWKRMLSGVKKAWETVAVKASVKPQVIGSDIKETSAPEMMTAKREDVATAIGVPHSLIFSNAANFATAQQDWLTLYTNTATPEFELIAEGMNEQFLKRLGMTIEPHPEQLEAYQQFELQKAQAVSGLVGEPVLSRQEGRDLLGYDLDPEELTPPTPVATELRRWQRKALKALSAGQSADVPFASDVLTTGDVARVKDRLARASHVKAVRDVFAREIQLEGQRDPMLSELLDELRAARAALEEPV